MLVTTFRTFTFTLQRRRHKSRERDKKKNAPKCCSIWTMYAVNVSVCSCNMCMCVCLHHIQNMFDVAFVWGLLSPNRRQVISSRTLIYRCDHAKCCMQLWVPHTVPFPSPRSPHPPLGAKLLIVI